jgi:hypothetical protein
MTRLLTCVFGPETHDDQKILMKKRAMLMKSQHSTPSSLIEPTGMAAAGTTSAQRGTGPAAVQGSQSIDDVLKAAAPAILKEVASS